MEGLQNALTFHDSWILDAFIVAIGSHSKHTNAVVCKNFVNDGLCNNIPAIVRLFRFQKLTENQDLIATVSDSKHKALAVFPFASAVSSFERQYRQRITFNTSNSLFLINKASLRFVNGSELDSTYQISPAPPYDVVVLEITECEIFHRDQLSFTGTVDASLTFVYTDQRYIKCVTTGDEEKNTERRLCEDYDDMISVEEDL